jgi:hypothetical protein
MEWNWVVEKFKSWWGKECCELTIDDVAEIVKRWQTSVVALDRLLYDDAKKEFSLVSRVGFGIDGTLQCKDVDFEQVRGDFENDTFVKMVLEHIEVKTALAEDVLMRLNVVDV